MIVPCKPRTIVIGPTVRALLEPTFHDPGSKSRSGRSQGLLIPEFVRNDERAETSAGTAFPNVTSVSARRTARGTRAARQWVLKAVGLV